MRQQCKTKQFLHGQYVWRGSVHENFEKNNIMATKIRLTSIETLAIGQAMHVKVELITHAPKLKIEIVFK